MTDQHGMTPSLRLAHVDGMLDYGREHGTIPLATFESARNHLAAVVNEHNALLAEVGQSQDERDGDVRAVAAVRDARNGQLDGRLTALFRRFADRIAVLEARDATGGEQR